MKMSKFFTSKQSIVALFSLTIIGSILFLIIQNQIIDIESESIKLEFEVKKQTERMLFDLKEILSSNTEKDYKTTESLALINNIRILLDKDYLYLRIEAQQNVNIIHNRLDEIEEEVIDGDFEEALELTNELIEDLEESEDLGSLGNNSNNNSENSSNNPDYSDDDDSNEEDSSNNNNGTENSNEGGSPTEETENENTEETTESNPTLKKGTTPSFDRNRNADTENSSEEVIELKIGE